MTAGASLLTAGIFSGKELHGYPRFATAEEFWHRFPGAAEFSVIWLLLYWAYKLIYRRGKPSVAKCVCMKCGKGEIALPATGCSCGGEFEDLDVVKWVES